LKLRKIRQERVEALADKARLHREEMEKLSDIKKYMFGKFIIKVPTYNFNLHKDIPLKSSFVKPYSEEKVSMAELAMKEAGKDRIREEGQQLVGAMIPKLKTVSKSEAPVGQPTKEKSLLFVEDPGATIEIDSTFVAISKLSTVLVLAAIITWLGIPLIQAAVEYLVDSMKLILIEFGYNVLV